MGRKKERQDALWVIASDLPKSAGPRLYKRLNVLLEARGFDRFAERLCERFYADGVGRPSLPPGRCYGFAAWVLRRTGLGTRDWLAGASGGLGCVTSGSVNATASPRASL